jgi:hypothetical protein
MPGHRTTGEKDTGTLEEFEEAMSKIVIEIEKKLDPDQYNRPFVTIKNISALKESELPKQYMKGYPNCFFEPCKLQFGISQTDGLDVSRLQVQQGRHQRSLGIKVGSVYPKTFFEILLKVVRKCADRLHEVKNSGAEEAKLNIARYADWVGKDRIEI